MWVVHVSSDFYFGKLSHNSPKPVLIVWSSIPCVLKVVSYYDLSVMSVVGFQRRLDGG